MSSFQITQGETLTVPITVVDDDGQPFDLSLATPRFVAARERGLTPVLDSEGSPATVALATNSPATDGVLTAVVASADTDDLLGTYEWECTVTNNANSRAVVASGYLTVKPKVA